MNPTIYWVKCKIPTNSKEQPHAVCRCVALNHPVVYQMNDGDSGVMAGAVMGSLVAWLSSAG